jgi:uncharacterized protein (TIGR03437 family)
LLIVMLLAQVPAAAQTSTFEPSFQLEALPAPCTTGTSARNVLTGDFNGDQKPDLAIVCAAMRTSATAEISVLLGNGDGSFRPPLVTSLASLHFYEGYTPFNGGNILALDLNGDGRTDILFAGYGPTVTVKLPGSTYTGPSTTVVVLLAAVDGSLDAPSAVATGCFCFPEASADLNGDGIPDLLVDGAGTDGGPAVMLGQAGGGFSAPSPLPTTADNALAQIGLAADFNGDGKPDVVIYTPSTAWILLNQGGGSFGPPSVVMSSSAYIFGQFLAGDFRGDGKLDLAALATTVLYVALGNGDGTFQQETAPAGIYSTNLVSLDLNGDGKLDLAQQAMGDSVIFYLSKGDGTFQTLPAITFSVPFDPQVVADFNGDGKPDMADFASVLINTTVIATTTGALNGASFAASEPLTPGSLVSIFGADFATSNAEAGAIPLPPALGGVSVTIGGTPAPLLFVSPGQINVQVPWDVSGSTADIVVTTAQGTALAPFSASIGPASPGIFTTQSGKGQAIAINPDGSLAGPTGSIPGLAVHPAKVGDALIILATGLGAVSPAIADGAAAGDTLRYTSATPTVLIGGATAPLAFSGLSPQFVGVNQLNVTVPKVAAGVVALQISLGGITTSNLVTIAVEEP